MDFRTLEKNGRWVRAIDIAGHVIIGLCLGSVLVQFLPDMMVPFLWLRSYRTNRLVPDDDWMLLFHKTAHTVWPVLAGLIIYVVCHQPSFLMASAQYFLHILWDQVTHPEPEFQKSMWRVDAG